jgi:hypothetical protein
VNPSDSTASGYALARFFGVSVFTIRAWRIQYEEFAIAMHVGKRAADDRVEEALFQRCVGYDFDFDLGRGKSVIRHVVPDVSAIRLWLFNRRPDRWRDKIQVEQTSNWADRSPQEIKRTLVQKMLKWRLIDPKVVPPDLLPPPDGTIDERPAPDMATKAGASVGPPIFKRGRN